jgi:hypothetical protein
MMFVKTCRIISLASNLLASIPAYRAACIELSLKSVGKRIVFIVLILDLIEMSKRNLV